MFEGRAPAEVTQGGEQVVGRSSPKAAGTDMVVIHLCLIAPAAGRFHGRLLCDTLFTGQLAASDRSHVLKCRRGQEQLRQSVFPSTSHTSASGEP